MATETTTTPAPSEGWAWLRAHERIVIVALVLLAGSFGLSRVQDARAAALEARATVAEQTLVAQKAQDSQLAITVAQVTQQYQQLTATLAAQNASLASSLAARQAVVAQNQTNDAALALPALANRLKMLSNAPEGTVTASGVQILLTQSGAVAVTQTLETIPALNADLADSKAVLGATQVTLGKANDLIADQGKQIIGLNLASVDASKVCTTQIAAVKAEANRSKRKWFLRGALVGFLGGLFAGHAGL